MCTHVARVYSHSYANTQTRTAPEQNSIINGLIAHVQLLWESEPATLNKIKPLLYIFIIPGHVLNCKCISKIHRCPSLLSPPVFPCCLTTATHSTFNTPPPCPFLLHVSLHVCRHTLTYTHGHFTATVFVCVRFCVRPPLSSLIKDRGCVCL